MIKDPSAQPHSPRNRNPFMDVHNQAVKSGMIGARTRQALDWYANTCRQFKNPISVMKVKEYLGESSARSVITQGGIYTYIYDAKTKEDLPYWDASPLVVIIKQNGTDRFMGLNLHYAPPKARALIMYLLYQSLTDTRMNEKTRLAVTYRKLERLASFRFFKPLVKQYLRSHVRSRFIKIPPSEWQTALFLPTAKWQKASSGKVYLDFNKKVSGF
jgi:hypothetical protein